MNPLNALDIIAEKRDGAELSSEEIKFFVRSITNGSIPDYQASAWLMAVYIRGMTQRETLDLTLAMRDSGAVIDLSDLPGVPLDKHSTGGVGDKTTLVVVPLLAAAGIPILKMSGRGLGFSGGTIDKLGSIPGFRTDLSIAQAKAQARNIGAALIAQSLELAPADKILYDLRNLTATVESIPLIASSIMSKKLAAGGRRIMLDVKVGQGAFMKTRARAEELAHALIAIGNAAGVPTSALLTRMDEPLGWTVGNALEVQEAILTLQNDSATEPHFRALCLRLAAHAMQTAEIMSTEAEAQRKAEELLNGGAGAAKFAEIIAAQGGPDNLEAMLAALPQTTNRVDIAATAEGYVAAIDAEAVGKLAVELGAGRAHKKDVIDPAVGITFHYKTGSAVKKGDVLATLHLRAGETTSNTAFATHLHAAFTISPLPPHSTESDLVISVID